MFAEDSVVGRSPLERVVEKVDIGIGVVVDDLFDDQLGERVDTGCSVQT